MTSWKRFTTRSIITAAAALVVGCDTGTEETPPAWYYITAEETALPSNNVYGVFVAADESWFATDKGLAQNKGLEWKIYNRANGLPSNVVFDVIVLPAGEVWAGTAGGAVLIKGGNVDVFTVADGLPSNRVVAVAYDGAKVWLGTDAGLARYDGGTFAVYDAGDGLPGNDVRDIHAVGREKLWVACVGGAAYYDWGRITSYTVANAGLPSHYVYAVAARGENAWLGTDKGLAHLTGGAVAKVYTNANSGLKSDIINDLAFDAEGNLWVATTAGASRGQAGTFFTFDESNGMLSSYVLAAWGDKMGYVWFGTLSGGVNRYGS